LGLLPTSPLLRFLLRQGYGGLSESYGGRARLRRTSRRQDKALASSQFPVASGQLLYANFIKFPYFDKLYKVYFF